VIRELVYFGFGPAREASSALSATLKSNVDAMRYCAFPTAESSVEARLARLHRRLRQMPARAATASNGAR